MEAGKLLIIVLAAVARLLPHPPNFTPIGGLALFSGSKLSSRFGFLIPLSAMFLSDLFLGFHSTIIYVYISFLIIFFVGRLIKKVNPTGLFFAILGSSFLFFLITNFGVWLATDMYIKNLNGLLNCYINGLPFFRNTLVGDLIYGFGFFYGYKIVGIFIKKLLPAVL